MSTLTERELAVYECYGRGLTTSLTAKELGLSVKTVSTYTARIREKLGIETPFLLKVQAYNTKGIPPEIPEKVLPILGEEVRGVSLPLNNHGNPNWALKLASMQRGDRVTLTGLTKADKAIVRSAASDLMRRKLGLYRTRMRDDTSLYVMRVR